MAIVETRPITGGVDTHLDVHVVAALNDIGGLLGVEEFAADPAGYRQLLGWLRSFGPVELVGVEGTGSYGAGLARHLRGAGIAVVEVDRPNRQDRHRQGKSDSIDAVSAARAALSGRATGAGKTRDGVVEAIRVLTVAKRSGREERIKTLNQLRQLAFCAPDGLRERCKDLSRIKLVSEAAALRPRVDSDVMVQTTKFAMRELARRIQALDAERTRIDALLEPLVAGHAPELLAVYGVGFDTAAILLVAAGDNAERLYSEAAWAHLCGVAPIPASSGKTTGRYRLNPGGNRQANHALHRIVITRMAGDARTSAYVARRTAEGRSKREITRSLKRYIAREIYRHLPRG